MSHLNLDDLNQTVIWIPYEDDDDEPAEHDAEEKPFEARDIPDGPSARFQAYRAAWDECLERIQAVIRDIHAPLARKLVHDVQKAYDTTLLGLPYPEIPTFAVCASGEAFITDIVSRLEGAEDNGTEHSESEEGATARPAHVIHLRPSECTNIMTTMKALISAFVSEPPGETDIKRRPTTSLAAFDINLLVAWYTALQKHHGENSPQLVVCMHDFEQFDPVIISDLFHICSPYIPDLPLIFVLALVSPPAPSFIHATYQRATLSLLQLQISSLPTGTELLERVILNTFFDLEYEPPIMPGYHVLDLMAELFTRHTPSLEGVSTVLQVAYLKHFDEPLTLLNDPDARSLEKLLSSPDAVPFLDSVISRLARDASSQYPIPKPKELLQAVDNARSSMFAYLRKLRLGMRLFLLVRAFFIKEGTLNPVAKDELTTVFEALSWGLRGYLSEWIHPLAQRVSAVSGEVKEALLFELATWLDQVPDAFNEDIAGLAEILLRSDDEVPADLGEWLANFWEEAVQDLEQEPLWDVCFMGSTPFPSEAINPAPRATVLSGLLDPYAFVETGETYVRPRRALWEMADTGILFRRYLEAGRMVNVYDWYEAFAMALETQRRRLQALKAEADAEMAAQKGKAKANGKGKGKAPVVEAEDDEDEDAEEKWKMHVQARFIRALHELDYLGFVKHTGRKADHIVRTVYDGAD
ncbi:hypothetical protein PENSPDRAFT_642136 [Peniophora sp. CONT]|nr:hypothetical protein PENSPDRAFT_642136 [Peniophora sp. CONT]